MRNEPDRGSLRRFLVWTAWVQAGLLATLALLVATRREREVPKQPDGPPPATPATSTLPAVMTARVAETEPPQPPTDTPPAVEPTPAASTSPPASTGAVLYGRVVDRAGAGITDGVLWFTRPGERRPAATIMLRPQQSEFAVAGLGGAVECGARVPGFKAHKATIEIPAGVPTLRHDVVLDRAWQLVVKVRTPEGRPLSEVLREQTKARPNLFHVQVGAVVSAERPEGDFPLTALREVTAGLGRWRSALELHLGGRGGNAVPSDALGVVNIDVEQPLFASAVLRHRVLATAPVQPSQPEVTLTVSLDQVLAQLGTIRGRVVDATSRQPVAEVGVSFGDLQSSAKMGQTGADGVFEVHDLRPGLLDLEIRGKTAGAPHDLVELAPGQTLDLGDVPIGPYRTIKGRCAGVQGKPEDGRVSWRALDAPSHPALRRQLDSTRLQSDGSFTLGLVEGRYLLRASGAGSAVVEIDTRARGDEPLVLQVVREATLRLDVHLQDGPCEMALFDKAGHEVFRLDLRDGTKLPVPLPPGDYLVEFVDRRGEKTQRPVVVGRDGLDLRVP